VEKVLLEENGEDEEAKEDEGSIKKEVAHPGKNISQGRALPDPMDQKPLPSLFPLAPLHLIFSEMPEPVTTIKAKEEDQKGGTDEKIEKQLAPGEGVGISLFLKTLSQWVQ
jgi:hypothetical protein